MARIARGVAPGVPHHITQRGNRRQQTFLCDEDYEASVDAMAQGCAHWGVEVRVIRSCCGKPSGQRRGGEA